LLVDFSDQKSQYDGQLFDDLLFKKNTEEPRSMSDYYYVNSYGKLNLYGNVVDWYTA